MKEKLKNAWLKVGKFLLWALLAALCCFVTYMVFVHRKLSPRTAAAAPGTAERNKETAKRPPKSLGGRFAVWGFRPHLAERRFRAIMCQNREKTRTPR